MVPAGRCRGMTAGGLTVIRAEPSTVLADWSWSVSGPLLLWTVAEAVLPALAPELSRAAYWAVAAAVVLVFTGSLALRALVQTRLIGAAGAPPNAIVLHATTSVVDGPVASIGSALLQTVAGALASFVTGAFFMTGFIVGVDTAMPVAALAAMLCLAGLNCLVSAVGLLPAWPLDGGRVLRSLLQRWGSARTAARIAWTIGVVTGVAVAFAAVWQALRGSLIVAVWLALLALTLRPRSMASAK